MKFLSVFLLFFMLASGHLFAQHYSCIAPEHKTWFNNAKGYLKGMRIDSVKIINNYNVYYPFHTARISVNDYGEYADTMGGSWMGKEIIEAADTSVTYLLNLWSDTITIKNNAVLNESWTWYGNTDSLHFIATVTDQDTRIINGMPDSVKTIRLTMMMGNTEQVNDSLNNLVLVLSKHNGFIKVVDLYLFPYRIPGEQASDRKIDIYLDEMCMYFTYEVTAQGITFDRVNYHPPVDRNVDNYNVGDMLYRVINTGFYNPLPRREQRDSVIAKTETASSTEYTIMSNYAITRVNQSGNGLEVITGTEVSSLSGTNQLLLDTVKMPEEWYTKGFTYFLDQDTSFCHRSDIHGWYNHFVKRDGFYIVFEDSRNGWMAKDGLGYLSKGTRSIPTEQEYGEYLLGARKGDIFCGEHNGTLSVQGAQEPEMSCRIFPNPASDYVRVSIGPNAAFSVVLTDIAGHRLNSVQQAAGACAVLDISSLPSGIYLLHIATKSHVVVRKFMVSH